MMHVIKVRNVNAALPAGLAYLKALGDLGDSRNGSVLVAPGPVTTVYSRPKERVLFSPLRDANPFFHLMESLWMLAGRDDVAFPANYAAQMTAFSDDGTTLNGAYGHRWRKHFQYDQLDVIIAELFRDPQSRRCVLSMWDGYEQYPNVGMTSTAVKPTSDLNKAVAGSKDVPCNTHAYFRIIRGELDMTVCNRSNDIVWGAYGANAVHFSMLQEYIAGALHCNVGNYYQISNNFHIYTERPDVRRLLDAQFGSDATYEFGAVIVEPLLSDAMDAREVFDAEVVRFCKSPLSPVSYKTDFLRKVAQPMALAHALHKAGRTNAAILTVGESTIDWLVAGKEWLERRGAKVSTPDFAEVR